MLATASTGAFLRAVGNHASTDAKSSRRCVRHGVSSFRFASGTGHLCSDSSRRRGGDRERCRHGGRSRKSGVAQTCSRQKRERLSRCRIARQSWPSAVLAQWVCSRQSTGAAVHRNTAAKIAAHTSRRIVHPSVTLKASHEWRNFRFRNWRCHCPAAPGKWSV